MKTPQQKAKDFLTEVYLHIEHGDSDHRRWLADRLMQFEGALADLLRPVYNGHMDKDVPWG